MFMGVYFTIIHSLARISTFIISWNILVGYTVYIYNYIYTSSLEFPLKNHKTRVVRRKKKQKKKTFFGGRNVFFSHMPNLDSKFLGRGILGHDSLERAFFRANRHAFIACITDESNKLQDWQTKKRVTRTPDCLDHDLLEVVILLPLQQFKVACLFFCLKNQVSMWAGGFPAIYIYILLCGYVDCPRLVVPGVPQISLVLWNP